MNLPLSTFDKWVRQAKTTGSFKSVDNLTDEQRELIELRKRNKELEMQLDILKQAAVIITQNGKYTNVDKTRIKLTAKNNVNHHYLLRNQKSD